MSLLRRWTGTEWEYVNVGRQTCWIPAGAWTPRETNGAELTTREINGITVPVLAFDKTADEGANLMLAMPESWNGEPIRVKPVWTASGGGAADTVQFEVRGGCFADDAAINVTGLGVAVAINDTWIADNDVHEAPESGDLTLANAAKSRLTILEIIRDVSDDDLDTDAELIGVRLFYDEDQPVDNDLTP